jgi:acyl carrier protein
MIELDSIADTIYTFLKKEMNHSNDFDVSTNIIERGIVDSMGILTLIIFLDKEFGIQIDLKDVNAENFSQVWKIAAYVKKTGEII